MAYKKYTSKKEKNNKKNILIASLIVVALAIISALFLNLNPTGNVTFNLQEKINENFELSLLEGELIPLSSKIKITSTDGNEKEYTLKELSPNETTNGNYYYQGTDLSSSGEGIGIEGERETYPTVYFEFKITKEESSSSDSNSNETTSNNTQEAIQEETNETLSGNETEPQTTEENISTTSGSTETEKENTSTEETNTEGEETTPENTTTESSSVETTSEDMESSTSTTEETNTEGEETISSTTEDTTSEPSTTETTSTEQSPGITGAVTKFISNLNPTGNTISNTTEEIIKAELKYGEEFTYRLNEGESIEIISESIRTEEKELNSSSIKSEISNGTAIFTTSYKETEKGFGEEFIGKEIKIPLDKNKVNMSNSDISTIELIINEEVEENLTEENTTSNESLANENRTINLDEINQSENGTEIILQNETKLPELNQSIVTLNEFLGTSNITTTKSSYRDKIIIKLKISDYEREYSYDNKSSTEELNKKIQEDKNNFIIDLAKKFRQQKFEKIELLN